ncbi:MAG TPA: N-acetyl-alpha-D-glucosaminyl L-malate synthase BshA [Candidatus Hydrogenedentes bacterium]|nr:N-acetyl-alpha-D-glucosaminyl L-malate synthase BshA [Candidatus Hydrogenedentota bacterium]HOJ67477.1 N-acetyl-alpha-D-glucosaminyl L-malate synthase BshA [Candidatus Hydrogenedentota bacterium]HOK88626.1 N-acetyl-alpha-D-glucosaminyl L-malate synthase BshA [Candidatus Hydrogenedentota bacterium]
MKIGITCMPSAGGSGVLATELGLALAERGHEVHFVTVETPFRLEHFRENVFAHVVDTITYPLFRTPPYTLALAAKIYEVASEHGIEIWHAHYAIPNAASALLARDMLPEPKRFCLVTTLHGTDITLVGSDPSFFSVTRHVMERSCEITAVSAWLARETATLFELSRQPRVIHNFFDPRKFYPRPVNRRILAADHEKIIMHISNFRPVKRVTDVVRAFRKTLDRIEARLIFVGDGPERISAVSVARQLGVADRITHLGNITNIEELLPAADLVFQPSEHESFGLVPLEAMACEVPVLATASGGIVEVIEDGVTGYLVEVGDIETMAARAIELLSDPDRGKTMGRLARQRVQERFTPEKIIPLYEALYAEVLEKYRQKLHSGR